MLSDQEKQRLLERFWDPLAPSKLNRLDYSRAHKIRALRFIHTIPELEWYGVHGLPDYVFDYIYHGTMLIDAPWIELIEDEFGQRLMKQYRGTSIEIGNMIEDSPLFVKHIRVNSWIWAIKQGDVSIYDFESYVFYSKTLNYKHKKNGEG